MTDFPSWARMGAVCVCINDDWTILNETTPSRLPMINEVLTVSGICDDQELHGRYLSFAELGHDWLFLASHFRPLTTVSQEDDIAMFLKIADRAPEKVE